MSTSLMLAGAVAGFIACADVDRDQGPNPVSAHEHAAITPASATLDQWTLASCQHLARAETQIFVKKLTISKSYADEAAFQRLGKFEFGGLKAGRLKLRWQSLENDIHATLWLQIKTLEDTWIFTKPLRSGDKVTRWNTDLDRVDTAPYAGIKSIVTGHPKGNTVVKSVAAGHIVFEDSIKSPPLVKRNQRIDLLGKKTGLSIRTKAVALTTGWEKGDQIQVTIEGSDTPLNAKVVGIKSATIEI